jgi:hypothetical protein
VALNHLKTTAPVNEARVNGHCIHMHVDLVTQKTDRADKGWDFVSRTGQTPIPFLPWHAVNCISFAPKLLVQVRFSPCFSFG